jgi:hypothetical protein
MEKAAELIHYIKVGVDQKKDAAHAAKVQTKREALMSTRGGIAEEGRGDEKFRIQRHYENEYCQYSSSLHHMHNIVSAHTACTCI